MFAKIFALVKDAFPLPVFADAVALAKWLIAIAPAEADLLAALLTQLKTAGEAVIDLPTGPTITIYQRTDGTYGMSEDHQALLCSAVDTEVGADGTWLEFLKALLPFLMQLLPFFIKKDPVPKPGI